MAIIHLLTSGILLSHICAVSLDHFQRFQILLILKVLLFLKCQTLISLVTSLFLLFGIGFLTSGTTSCQILEGSLPECLQQQQTIYTHPGPIMPKMSWGILLQLEENETRNSV